MSTRFRPVLVLGLFALLGVTAALVALATRPPRTTAPLPVLGQVAAFALPSHRGERFDSQRLQGKVWVANFIFTRCPSICPAFSKKMADIQSRTEGLGEAVQLLSFTVDPDHDTPAVLGRYAEKYGAGPRWTFLTGARDALRQVVVSSLKVHMEEGAPTDLMSVAHGAHFVLVDGEGRVRGYYRLEDEGTASAVAEDAARLTAQAPALSASR